MKRQSSFALSLCISESLQLLILSTIRPGPRTTALNLRFLELLFWHLPKPSFHTQECHQGSFRTAATSSYSLVLWQATSKDFDHSTKATILWMRADGQGNCKDRSPPSHEENGRSYDLLHTLPSWNGRFSTLCATTCDINQHRPPSPSPLVRLKMAGMELANYGSVWEQNLLPMLEQPPLKQVRRRTRLPLVEPTSSETLSK